MHAYVADVEEEALKIGELVWRQAEEASSLVHHSSGEVLICVERVCKNNSSAIHDASREMSDSTCRDHEQSRARVGDAGGGGKQGRAIRRAHCDRLIDAHELVRGRG